MDVRFSNRAVSRVVPGYPGEYPAGLAVVVVVLVVVVVVVVVLVVTVLNSGSSMLGGPWAANARLMTGSMTDT